MAFFSLAFSDHEQPPPVCLSQKFFATFRKALGDRMNQLEVLESISIRFFSSPLSRLKLGLRTQMENGPENFLLPTLRLLSEGITAFFVANVFSYLHPVKAYRSCHLSRLNSHPTSPHFLPPFRWICHTFGGARESCRLSTPIKSQTCHFFPVVFS